HPAMVIEEIKREDKTDLSQRAISAPSMTHRTVTKRPLHEKRNQTFTPLSDSGTPAVPESSCDSDRKD
ncbi:hypothetical protein, partial [Alishewanella agri]|uniref:hypothetical protein n=1 Tax=Alishewanella agri TaxID=553384 RepID=UPI001ED9143A